MEERFIANPDVAFRDDLNGSAVLYNPQTGKAFSVNSVGSIIWRSLSNEITLTDLIKTVNDKCSDVPSDLHKQVFNFVGNLKSHGLVGVRITGEQ